jgi:hypothetical protein
MDHQGITLIFLFLLLLCLVEYLLHYYGIKQQYDRQNLYQKASCTLTNKKYITTKTDKQLFDPYYDDGKEIYGSCHKCSDSAAQDPTKDCDYMMKMKNNSSNSGNGNGNDTSEECCIHLSWHDDDCCTWVPSSYTSCDENNNCNTYDDSYCGSYSETRIAFIKDKIYTITYDINIDDLGTLCSKTEKCLDPITSQDCLTHKMDDDYENTCYYKKQESDICNHLSEDGHLVNKLIVVVTFIIMIILVGLYCWFYSIICEEYGSCMVTSTRDSRRNRNRYIELV